MVRRTVSRRQLRFEQLEGRAMMAGDVSVVFDNALGGPLELNGDDAANVLKITQVGENSFKVKGINTNLVIETLEGTQTVKSFVFENVSDVSLFMNGGNDAVAITNVTINGTLTVDMASGNDALTLINVQENVLTSPEGLASISLGEGNDLAVLLNVRSNADIFIDAGSGRDGVSLTRVVAGTEESGNSLTVEMGPGDRDALTVAFSRADFANFSDTGGTNGLLLRLRNNFFEQTNSGFRFVI